MAAPTSIPVIPASVALEFEIKTFRFSWCDVPDATHYRLLENPDGSSGFSQVGGDIAQGTQVYKHIVPLFKRFDAAYILQSCNAFGCVDGSRLSVTGGLTEAIGYFKASNSALGAEFGYSVSLSDDGSTLAVGARYESGGSGAVHVFRRTGGSWTETALLEASNADDGDAFGYSVSLSDDGNALAVGARWEDSGSAGINSTPDELLSQSGAAYVYRYNGIAWFEQAYLKAGNPGMNDEFGWAVSLSGDGNTLAVGAVEDSGTTGINTTPDEAAADSGAVYIYRYNTGVWSQEAFIKSSNSEAGDVFGASVSLSQDGNILLVGAYGEDSDSNGVNTVANELAPVSGAAYVFDRSGATWTESAYIKASNSGVGDVFGTRVELSGDGKTMVIGAYLEDSGSSGMNSIPDDLNSDSGAAYVFFNNGATWAEQAYIKSANPDVEDYFGVSVSLSNDGNVLLIGAHGEDGGTGGIGAVPDELAPNAGAAYVFIRNGATWSELTSLKATDPTSGDQFGLSLDVSGDGNTLAVGAYLEDSSTSGIGTDPDELAAQSGAVYVY